MNWIRNRTKRKSSKDHSRQELQPEVSVFAGSHLTSVLRVAILDSLFVAFLEICTKITTAAGGNSRAKNGKELPNLSKLTARFSRVLQAIGTVFLHV